MSRKLTSKKEVLQTLSDLWAYLGSAEDNGEPVDCDECQAQLLAVGDFLQELWQVDHEGDSVQWGAAVKLPKEGEVDLFEEFLVREDGTTKYEEEQAKLPKKVN